MFALKCLTPSLRSAVLPRALPVASFQPPLSRSFSRADTSTSVTEVQKDKARKELSLRDDDDFDVDLERFTNRIDNLFGNWMNSWDPFLPSSRRFHELQDFRDRFYREMDDVFDTDLSKELATWQPKTRIVEKEGKTLIKAEMPGLSKEDVKVDFSKGILTLKGEKQVEVHTEGSDKTETRSFLRSFRLPEETDPKDIKAKMEHGVLEVSIPSKQQHADNRGQAISID